MPRGKEYLVTALSVFFSLGAVFASLVAIILIPKNTCDPPPAACDLDRNLGWKYELVALGLIVRASPLLISICLSVYLLHKRPSRCSLDVWFSSGSTSPRVIWFMLVAHKTPSSHSK